MLEAACPLFWLQGYALTTISEILKRAEVNPGSFYFLFKTKENLLIAILDHYSKTLVALVIEPFSLTIADPIERVFAVLEYYRNNLLKTGCTYSCPLGRLALEISEEQPRIQNRIATNFDDWTAAIEKCLQDARPRLPANIDLKALSSFVLSVMQGGIMQARTRQSIEPYDASVKHLRAYFNLLQLAYNQRNNQDGAKACNHAVIKKNQAPTNTVAATRM
ncbi:MAG: TetR/AcrR family transcriptional regulator [Acidobacteriota bacterium]|nr:TetR/AcrR family transcriptional regulator [Acidobacteriota bacterium]